MDQATILAELNAAEALAAAGNLRAALSRVQTLFGQGANDARVLTRCAIYEYGLKNPKQAHQAVLAALEQNPNYALAHRVLGIVLAKLQNFGSAEAAMREAIRLEPDEAFHHLALAQLLEQLDKCAPAEESYRKALALAPEHADMMSSLGRFLAGRRRFDEAAPLIVRALEAAPDDPAILYAAGQIALAQNRDDDARDYATAILQQDGAHEGALELLVQLRAKRGWFMGVWWRWAMLMSRMSGFSRGVLIVGLLFGAQIFFRALKTVLPPPLLIGCLVLWVGFCILTWVGPSIYKRMLAKEMKKVQLRPDF
jgi:Tfp pilus assembly protein PilF